MSARRESPHARMLFFHRGTFSGINRALLNAWQEQSPGVTVSAHDLAALAWDGVDAKLMALPHVLRLGGLGLSVRSGQFRSVARRTPWYIERQAAIVDRIQREHEFDFILSTGSDAPILRPRRPLFIYTDHTILANRLYPDGEARLARWQACVPYETAALGNATLVFTMSHHVTQSLIEHYGIPESRVVCAKAGANAPRGHLDPARFAGQHILFVGVEWERKGGPQLLEAFRRVRQSHSLARLTIAGCSPQISDEGVTVLGRVSPERVGDLYGTASVFCMPSRFEPFGIVYLEAMRSGLPVIASNVGAPPDFVIDGDTGYLVPPGDVVTLALRLTQLVGNPDACRAMGERARALVEQEYSWHTTQRTMWTHIRRALTQEASL